MGLCCCFCRSKKGRRENVATSVHENEQDPLNNREVSKNRESTYTTGYSMQYSDETKISNPSDLGDPLTTYNWYFGIISRMHAHELLRYEMDGTFLVRQSTDSKSEYPYIISVKHKPPDGTTDKENFHYRIRRDENGYFTLGWNLYFKTVKDLLEYYKGKTDILKVPLKTFIDQNPPVS